MGSFGEGLVSVIMPAYNAEQLIGKTIESLQLQSYQDWELMVIDDCSSDNTAQVVKEYASADSRIKVICLDRNHGAPAAPRNIGVQKAAGEWVALLDADDIWHPKKLEFQMRYLKETGAQFCSTQMMDFVDEPKVSPLLLGEKVGVERVTFSRQLRRYRTPTSSVVLKKQLLLDYPFNEDIRYKAREDLDCWLRIHEHIEYSIKLLFPFLYYRLVQGQISGSKWTMIRRTLLVLGEYKLATGEFLGWRKYLYVGTHILYSIYYRIIKRAL